MAYPAGGYSKLNRDELLSLIRQGDANAKIALRKLDKRNPGPSKRVGVIDLTPTWQGMVGTLLTLYENGNNEARDLVEAEFRKMAKAADLYNASVKNG